ncbi:MAG: oxidoreductase [Bacteroidetes bacterium GWE2_41_25]|nr:MAG: oxidoreductase [Bacteroidetes bacterium GWA2_40_15]OFX99832.1 MAG: oxidoreductase [Bacteroidetes bacterium GWE2_41_25]HAM11300.1 gfo/Idh/MocA family oxidoreductase [Bacteroidales bacterium]HBH82568.1 gfo/Idh/MocA family oxidoreductase [Bacteroidales bacterium]HBQ84153.1 gfo/Idh/MocA family oxidoreductase [Bacteroidales bacterium]
MKKKALNQSSDRRKFIKLAGSGVAAMAIAQHFAIASGAHPSMKEGENRTGVQDASKVWVPVSDRKIRVGIVGYGASRFGAAFGFQNHPNVEVVAVSDLFPDRCAALAKACRCNKTYPSLEELVKDDNIEAVFCATDAASHAQHAIEVLKHGKHVAVAVPAVFGSIEEADRLLEAVKTSGLKYMMFETSCFHEDLYAMHQIYKSGGFGKLVYSEGEYYHPPNPDINAPKIGSYKGWRDGVPPQWYPTHSNAYYVGVTNGSFTEVTCLGMKSLREIYQPGNNRYKNPFASEIALFRTNEGGMARMAISWDTPGFGAEAGRIRGQKGSYYGKYEGLEKVLPDINRPPLPPGVEEGGHGGSHGRLMHEFITSIIQDRKPLVDIVMALNMTVSGIVAHASAMKDGELMKIPQYKF